MGRASSCSSRRMPGRVGGLGAHHDPGDALGGQRVDVVGVHVDRSPAGVVERRRVASGGLGLGSHHGELLGSLVAGQPTDGEVPVAATSGSPGCGQPRSADWIGRVVCWYGFGKLHAWSRV